jgi:hypothetical protein
MKTKILKVLNESVSKSHAIEQNVILEWDFDKLADKLVELFIKPNVSNFVLLLKPNYKAKDGTIKRGIEIDGKYYAPQNDC